MDTNRISLHAKRACVTFMAMLFAWQPVGTNLAYAVELNAGETAPATEQAANTQGGESSPTTTGSEATTSTNTASSASPAQTDNEQESTGNTAGTESSQQTGNTVSGNESNATETAGDASTGSKASAKSGSDQGSKNTAENGNDSNEAAPQSSEEGIALADSGTYSPEAAFVDISSHCDTSSTLYKDAAHSTPLDSTAIAANETFYATMNVQFQEGYRPTLSSPNVSYTFPSNLKVADMPETNLQDGNTIAGTWYIKDNVAYLKYNEDYLKDTVLHAYANISCSLGGVDKGDGGSETITFPGSSESITVNTKDGSVSGSKFGGNMDQQWNGPTYDQATNSYTWTVKVSPTAHATNVVLTDTIGSNLTFVDGSFVIVDSSGKQTGTASATVDDQTATISLGDLTAGDYYVQYKTTVKSLPTTDNTDISNANNSVECNWGTTDRGYNSWKSSGSPQSTKYSMVTKTVDSGQSTPDSIRWVVTLNSGSIKADMGGYTFSDTVGNDQSFNTSADVTVTDLSTGNVIQVDNTSVQPHSLSFKLPSDAGEKQYQVVYYTHISSTSSKDAVSNTAEVTPPTTSKLPSGKATAKYTPPDTGTYISKALEGTVNSTSYNGKASWKSEILFSDMSESTDPTSIVFKDVFSSLPNGVQVSLDGDVTLTTGSSTTLVEGTDYTITKAESAQGTWGELFKITFKGSDTVKNLIGASGAKVVVKYATKTTQVSGEYPGGTYKNKSSVTTDKKSEISAEADYTIEKEIEPPAVIKNGSSTSWNADYAWSDGTKGAWITDWTAYVNRTSKDNAVPVIDLEGKDVIVTDTLPANSEVVVKSAKYKLKDNFGQNESTESSAQFTSDEGVATFTISTKNPTYHWGSSMGTTKVSVILTYQTATKGKLDSKETITNTAQAQSGSYNFPSGEGTATFDNKALSKTGEAISGSSARKYTITVNENAYDLVANSDTLTLVDDLDYRGELAASTISVKSGSGDDLLANKQASYSLSNVASDGKTHTRLTITLPDSAKAIVTYQVIPAGSTGEKLENFSNACKLSGVKSSELNLEQNFVVAASSGGTSSENLGLSITKFDYNGKKTLEGAVFELHQVDLDKSSKGDIVENKIAEATSNAKGKVSFGTAANPLASNTLYYFVETKAPAGYEISYTGKTYVMLKSGATKADYQAAFDKAVVLGLTPSSSRNYSAFDELSKGSFELSIEKKVEGAAAPAGAAFTFHAKATGSNAASAPKLSDVTVKSTARGASTYTGHFTGTLSDGMQGKTFTYNVSETGTAPSGWTYDSGAYTATVKVVEQNLRERGTRAGHG